MCFTKDDAGMLKTCCKFLIENNEATFHILIVLEMKTFGVSERNMSYLLILLSPLSCADFLVDALDYAISKL